MNISDAARHSGLPAKTIRYYEDIGLITPERRANGYRDFSDQTLDRLRLLAQARLMGFSLEECRKLLALNADEHRASRDVRALAEQNLASVRAKITELQALEARLEGLVAQCHGDDDPECAILDGLTGTAPGCAAR
ncbi:MerR family transcriptional regulator [Pseudooceanicola sp. CBS1P-1]|uniref:HTH-type transcriptional regulator CueR n=1 Tax=Pseudooceanicola albus TaxID=2692189 RepID=A0A6L7G6K2_9RHOB|nr:MULTISPECIES: MerR family transcriptional regulator [Pseudooceanicola]MBT9382968.1 MerR family transcriptional regulator [Pseudooceanicola endophyticus]MXN19157.1 MerR family transcriptional regulator [Pseudooceanicola albus]